MAALLVVSPAPLAGKTTIVAGIAQRLRQSGSSPSLARAGDDANADADRGFLTGLSSATASTLITECPAGDFSAMLADGVRVLAVIDGATSSENAVSFVKPAGSALAGVVINRATTNAGNVLEAIEAAGIPVLAVLGQDRLLAAPALGDVASALHAEPEYGVEERGTPLNKPVIASIAADPGQTYFDRTGATAVIVRSDKPDLQLAALNAGASCLIVTGGLPVLSYVSERVEADGVPLMLTEMDTKEAVLVIEGLYASTPFSGGVAKMRRLGELFADLDLKALTGL